MALLDPFTAVVRSVVSHGPVKEALTMERDADDLAHALHRAADTAERHIESIDQLAATVPALTDSVNQLTSTLNELLQVLGPLAAAERDVSRLGHLFGRRGDA